MASSFVKPATAPRIITPRIVEGFDGPVEIDVAAQTVTKTFLNPEPAVAVLKAKREVEYASRFYAAVAGVSGISCPKILRSDFTPPPRVTLQLCPGDTLWVVVGATQPDDPGLDQIAGRIHDCIEFYVATFPRSRHDFKLENMLYDSDNRVLTLIDFANDAEHEMSRDFPLDAAVGNWLGRVCYDLVRPSKLRARTASYQILMRKVLKTFEGQVVQARVRDFAYTAFRMWGPCGTATRRAYYRAMETMVVSRYLKRSGLKSQPNVADVAG
jgi:hypothetical protein